MIISWISTVSSEASVLVCVKDIQVTSLMLTGKSKVG
jgi:hypothetical protein